MKKQKKEAKLVNVSCHPQYWTALKQVIEQRGNGTLNGIVAEAIKFYVDEKQLLRKES